MDIERPVEYIAVNKKKYDENFDKIQWGKKHLCDTCVNEYPYCGAVDIVFSCDLPNGYPTSDDIVECDAYNK